MRRKIMLGVAAVAVATILVCAWFLPLGRGNAHFSLPQDGKPAIDPLPITHLVLFNSGVGYVQREGIVDGDANIDLMFSTSDINDLLKSMVLEDLGGGKVSVISYDSSEPTDRILRSFALDLTGNPTFGQLLNQARGEQIEATVRATKDSPQTVVKGSIVGMEVRKVEAEKQPAGADVDFLNLLTEKGLKSVGLNQIEQVRFASPVLEHDFQEALKVLARAHDVQKKRVTLSFKGAGQRKVRIGYVVEKPIWKMAYRLRMEPKNHLYLQGWAIVENTSDDDWSNVEMTLVSGKPISFKMDLYDPLYIPRPTVEPDLFASLRPPVYDSNLEPGKTPPGQPGPNQGPMPGQPQTGQFGGQFGGGFNFGGGGFNQFGGQGQFGMNQYQKQQELLQQFDPQQKKLTFEELQKRQKELKDAKEKAKDVGEKVLGMNFKEGIQSVATAEDIGDYYQYRLDQKVTLNRRRSAMLPVFTNTVDGQKVSIYSRSVHKRYPLLGLRFKNTTDHPLTQGPVTVYDESNYGGDTRILDVQPKEERLLSYAMDLGTKVFVNYKIIAGPKMHFKVGGDKITATYTSERTTTYDIKNDSRHDRRVILEQPIELDWKLVTPAKPESKTTSHYRFEVDVVKGRSKSFDILQEQKRVDSVSLVGATKTSPAYWSAAGIEVQPIITHTPGPKMAFKIGSDQLTATYTNMRLTRYVVKNDSDREREIVLEHPLDPDWKVIGPAKADEKKTSQYRLALTLAKGKSGTVEILEEQQRADPLSLITSGKNTPMYSVASGIAVKPMIKSSPEELVELKIAKGLLQAEHRVKESRTYFVQNHSDQDRTFTIDYPIRSGWALLGPNGKSHPGPGVHRFELEVKAGKTGVQEIREEKTELGKKVALTDAGDNVLKAYLENPAVSKGVKEAIEKFFRLHQDKQAENVKLSKLRVELTSLIDNQNRLRDNLKTVPQNSDPYKQFLNKFVKLETQIEELQDRVREAQNALEKKTSEYEEYYRTVSAK